MDNQYMTVVEYFNSHYSEFLWQVLVPIFGWLLLMLAFFIMLFAKYTFGNWTSENPNPYQDETWGMPRGTFRGTLTLTLLYVAVILEVVNVRIVGFETEINQFMVAFQMMIAFYFGAKVMHHITSSDKKKAYALAQASTTNITQGININGGVSYENPPYQGFSDEGDDDTPPVG